MIRRALLGAVARVALMGGRAVAVAIAVASVASAAPGVATGDEGWPPRIESVDVFRDGRLLACAVRARGLPGDRIASSLPSGLPSALELALEVLDDEDRVVGGNRISFRIAFDLWEEAFKVEGVGGSRRFHDLASLESFLETFPRLPIAPLTALDADRRHRVRVEIRLHPLAPRETDRLGEWVAGGAETSGDRRGPGGEEREVSVSLGEVIRFFYRGESPRGDLVFGHTKISY